MSEPKGQERSETPEPPIRSEVPVGTDSVSDVANFDGYHSDVWQRLEDWPAGDSLH